MIVRKSLQLDGVLTTNSEQLEVVFSLFHQNMLQVLETITKIILTGS